MIQTRFIYSGKWKSSSVFFSKRRSMDKRAIRNLFHTRGNKFLIDMEINIDSPTWRMDYCHELGHILTAHRHYTTSLFEEYGKDHFRWEVEAWRLAKSFCKSKYWSEQRARAALYGYIEPCGIKIDWEKFKIIELTKVRKIINEKNNQD